jgi:hypothetical protein
MTNSALKRLAGFSSPLSTEHVPKREKDAATLKETMFCYTGRGKPVVAR